MLNETLISIFAVFSAKASAGATILGSELTVTFPRWLLPSQDY